MHVKHDCPSLLLRSSVGNKKKADMLVRISCYIGTEIKYLYSNWYIFVSMHSSSTVAAVAAFCFLLSKTFSATVIYCGNSSSNAGHLECSSRWKIHHIKDPNTCSVYCVCISNMYLWGWSTCLLIAFKNGWKYPARIKQQSSSNSIPEVNYKQLTLHLSVCIKVLIPSKPLSSTGVIRRDLCSIINTILSVSHTGIPLSWQEWMVAQLAICWLWYQSMIPGRFNPEFSLHNS